MLVNPDFDFNAKYINILFDQANDRAMLARRQARLPRASLLFVRRWLNTFDLATPWSFPSCRT